MLHRFWTGFALAENGWAWRLVKCCPTSFRQRLGKRVMEISSTKLCTLPLLDCRARKAARIVGEETSFFERNRRFQEAIPDREILAANVVIGFDTSAWLLGRRAKVLQRTFILDQSIGHPAVKERIFESLRQRFPDWSTTAPKKSAEIMAVEREEHALADAIVVPSEFVKQTLMDEGVNESKIRIIPFGTDLTLFHPPEKREGKPVVFLFVGGLTARKGVPVLLASWRQLALPDAELWLAGPGCIPASESATLPPTIKLLGTKNRQEVAALMRQADVFVFPSFFEGLAQVQIEALATGLPLIATHEAGAADLIQDGSTGFLIHAGDVDELAGRIQKLAQDPSLRQQMQQAVLAVRERLSWQIYGRRWSNLLEEIG